MTQKTGENSEANSPQEKKGKSTESLRLALFQSFKREECISGSFLDDLPATKQAIDDSYKKSRVAARDHYGNSLASIGTEDRVEDFTSYSFSNDTNNYLLWLALYNDSWVFARAIDKPAEDEVRCGVSLAGATDKTIIYTQLKKYRQDLIKLLKWGALFGGSVAIMMFDGLQDDDYSKPLSSDWLRKNKPVMQLYVTDRWYGCAVTDMDTVDNMRSLDFGKPKFYNITFADGKQLKVHHSFVLRYEHRAAPQLIKCGQLQGWGYAEGAHILHELSRDDQLKTSIQSLINKALIEVIKMPGMRGVFMGADTENETQLQKRLEMVNWARTYNSLTFLDSEDEYEQNTFGGLSGLSDLLENNMWMIAAALEMQGVLFGDLKNGLGADEGALQRYDDVIQGRCEAYLRPVLTKLLTVFYKMYDINEPVDFTFNSLLKKQNDKEKMEGLQSFQQLLSAMFGDGVITLRQYALAMRSYTTNGTIDLNITEQDLNELEDKFDLEKEDLGLEGEPNNGEALQK